MNITTAQFKQFSDLVYHACGIDLHNGKKQLLQTRLSKCLRRTGISSVSQYLRTIEADTQELMHFLDAISTNHTYFFRESHHLEQLREDHKNIWCAASSSGEEPYSVAIACLEKGFQPRILATDISTHVLKLGQMGIYPVERAKHVPSHILRKYFQKGQGKYQNHIRIKDHVKQMVTFKRYNLLTDSSPQREFDVIFCRNVLIYFDNIVKARVIDSLYKVLKFDGLLIIGGAESLNNIPHRLKYIRPSIYKKAS